MFNNQKVGNLGENIACKFLINRKFKIIERNHREKFDEIDIIAKSFDGTIVFVEVKTLNDALNKPFGISPEDHMTKNKFYKIRRGCLMFIAKHPRLLENKMGWRIDLIAITISKEGNPLIINHYENIIY